MINCPIKKDQVQVVVKDLLPTYYGKLYYLPIAIFKQLYAMDIQLEDGMNMNLNTYQPKRSRYQPASN